ncbi:hypothetical protein ID128_04675 [Candidatus Wolbachia massiliensis]|uniref:Uncharacterized protein n=1 Tax=Candidatus Wolbachia massiliensis TaxID=1845000 RepID=A0A7M3U369_9RICK|nr:hypothetical protein ID128_04675 [Candidatus Wolbachia massiliensis]
MILEHSPTIPCENRNIHTDHKEHLVYCEDNGNATKYEDIENEFINDAHGYLIQKELNVNFKQKDYERSNFSKKLTQIEMERIYPGLEREGLELHRILESYI